MRAAAVPRLELGVGVSYRPELHDFLEAHPDRIDVIEVEPQTLCLPSNTPDGSFRALRSALDRIVALPQPKLVHSVGIPVGGSRMSDPRHVPLLNEFIGALDAPWCSEHLSFNTAVDASGPFFTGFFLPPRQSAGGLRAAVDAVRMVSSHLDVPLAIETGVNYLRPRDDEMGDGEFVAAVAERAGCGILLDLHNVWSNARNGRQQVASYLRALPKERVWELHLAGGHEFRGFWIDAHSGAIPREVLALAEDVVPELPNLRAIIFELDAAHLDALGAAGLLRQLDVMTKLWARRGTRGAGGRPLGAGRPRTTRSGPSAASWENTLGALAIGRRAAGPLAEELSSDPALPILRTLVNEARAGMIVSALRFTVRLLLFHLGEPAVREMMQAYWRTAPPRQFACDEGIGFARHLMTVDAVADVPHASELLAFELAVLRSSIGDETATIRFRADPAELFTALEAGWLPPPPGDRTYPFACRSDQRPFV
ncbi:MAG TPA: DUF692 family protein [Candidatus Dormibacteraeota bacterium]|nr:DUF692 family protein [Candidatus Dormibacteraeota bacterium]